MAINFDKAQVLKEALSILDSGSEKAALTVYNGDPNGNVTATAGALCIDYSGSGKLWKNTNSSTTWVELGSGGGSPYPENFIILTSDTTLTSNDQGYVYLAGGKPTLPASAPDGTIYKLMSAPADMYIDTNGATISGMGSGSNLATGVGQLTLLAVNSPSLVWLPLNTYIAGGYYSDRVYKKGDFVFSSDVPYLSLVNNNTGNALTDATKWLKLGPHIVEDEGTPVSQQNTINFTGSGVTVTNSGSKTVVTIPGGSASPYFDDDGGTPTTAPSAAASDSIAIGEGASVGAGATNSFAIGTSATVATNALDAIAIGRSSSAALTDNLAIGKSSNASGLYSTAIGRSAIASGTNSISIRGNASGTNAVSIGSTSSAIINSVAMGVAAHATGQYSVSIGSNAVSPGTTSIAIGRSSSAALTDGVSIGRNTNTANGSVAVGPAANAGNSANSVSIGNNSRSNGIGTVAIGYNAIASSNNSASIGSVLIGQEARINVSPATNVFRRGIAIGRSAQCANNTPNGSTIIGDSIAIGYSSNVSSPYSISIGRFSTVRIGSNYGIAIGDTARTGHTSFSSIRGIAIGFQATSYNYYSNITDSIALGSQSITRVINTIQTQATSIIRKDEAAVHDNTTDTFKWGASNEAVLMTKEIDLKTAATKTITVPAGSRFYPNEVGLILTTLTGTITLQPDVSFGITGTNNKFVTQTTSSLAVLYERDVYTSLTTAGESSLTFTVNVAATGSADIKGRAYFKGMLVEIQ